MQILLQESDAEAIEISLADFDSAAHGAAPMQPAAIATIFLPLAGQIDIDAERAKLEKQQQKLQGWIKASEAKLSNERFLAKAPENVVAEAKTHLAELKERLTRVTTLAASLR